ncbi:MAG TPA: mechanosensitive ion channel family protein [Anaerovoracaceae bacterium]|nr:mechanosensitive ion channel family protein [Anaerovoracaceae bacterium]
MSENTIKTLIGIGIAFGIILVGYIVISILCRIIRKALDKSKLDEVLHTFIINCIKIVLWIMVLITSLSYAGIPVSAFLAALGAAGVAVALALKDSLGNFAGGILIILSKPFKKGDYIEDYQTAGQVERIDLLYTTLLTFDNKVITIPNGKLANSTIVNYTRSETRRVDCIFSVTYQEDIMKVKDILQAVAESNPIIFTEPAPQIGVARQGEGRIEVDLKVWCNTLDYLDVKYFLEEQVKLAFDEADIQMAYPQMEVQIKKK